MVRSLKPTLEELTSIGEEVQRSGFTIDRLHRATTIFYWNILHQPGFNFEPGNVQVVDYEVVAASSHDQERKAFQELWKSLPRDVRSKITPRKLWGLCYSRTRYGVQSALMNTGSALVGNYNTHRDICYLAEAIPYPEDPRKEFVIPEDDKLSIGAHELSHRFLYHRRIRLKDPQARTGLIGPEEEDFCEKVGDLFERCAFPPNSEAITPRQLGRTGRKLSRKVGRMLHPRYITSYTRAVVTALSQLGQNYLEKGKQERQVDDAETSK